MRKYLLLLVSFGFLFTTAFAQNKSNKGKEFWLAYGHNNLMNPGQGNGQTMVLYLSAEQPANVTVSIPGIGYTTGVISIPANTVDFSVVIPKTGTYDARLSTAAGDAQEGLFAKGINIKSDTPIVAYAHQYGTNSSGATMLMPVETYGYTYYSINYTQSSNATFSYSWFYVVASEDNTKVNITPSQTTVNGWQANQTYSVNLNKGEVYNVLGALLTNSGGTSTGRDLTGSKIVSVAGADGNCHPIAVFSGSSRMVINATSGGDVMQQQIFPASAWGTRYLTYPTCVSNTVNPNLNFFRVVVRDPSTIVKRNGVVLTGMNPALYYDYSSTSGDYIEADKPILVAQFIPSGGAFGDPEMFYLSPIEQAIKTTTFYNSSNQVINANNHYVSVIVPNGGVGFSSLKIDGSSSFDYTGLHPQNNNYRVVIKRLSANSQHTVQSDSAFTAITYGLGSAESYGYNAGTLINNLNNIGGLQNSFGTGVTSSTCTKTPFRFSVKAAYKPTQMVWQLSQIPTLLPVNADTTVNNPTPIDSSTINGRKYYTYMLPREYYLNTAGTYTLPIVVTAPEIDNCSNTETITTQITVVAGPVPDFTWTYSGCVSDTAYLSGIDPTVGGFTISKYRWFYDDNTQDSLKNVKKKFNSQGNHPTTFRVITNTGCIGDTTKTVVTAASPLATFGMNPPQACGSATVTFTDTSSFPNGLR